MINRLILWLALAGMILTLHLWIQKSRGFDQGCLGLATHADVVIEKGCREVSELPGGHLFGVSNAAWGYAFYFTVALLAFGKIVSAPIWARRMHAASEVLTAVDVIRRDEGGLLHHYVLVAVFCRWLSGEGVAADDAEEAGWFDLDSIRHLSRSPDVERVAALALARA